MMKYRSRHSMSSTPVCVDKQVDTQKKKVLVVRSINIVCDNSPSGISAHFAVAHKDKRQEALQDPKAGTCI